ncbi:LuxR C-terminal-related transcriptional regulator [Paenibacillus kobensis]|uniref:LuxR C-terminal-related transcriptional regulator n=1 Tax=Paenibacillus kobensis TaxID=59841 RepID=UPI000FD8E880|nr:LuxR C-terminal-related transcriptional regulator [Paenibacillus kobensis]
MNSNPTHHSPNHIQHIAVSSRTLIPKQTTHYVMRSRLMNKLSDIQRVKLTIIAASAGFGKTSLAAEWARHRTESTVWLSLEAKDNDPLRFWASIVLSVTAKVPIQLPTDLLIQSIREGSIDVAVSLLLDELQRSSEPLAFILDDYHLITDENIHESLFSFITYLPAQHHLVILSRTIPPFPLARLRAQQELLEVNSDDLRFNLAEIQHLQALSLRPPLTIGELSLLEHKTEGWVAGIILALLSLTEKKDRTAFMASFSGNHRHIFDYLIDEVLSQQPEEKQSFLLRTSILHSFSASLAEAVHDVPRASQHLADIELAQLFLIPLDETRTWYRYHHLFAEMLQARLYKKESAQARAELHRRASRWYEQANMIIESVHHSLEAEEYADAAARMVKHFNYFIDQGEDSTLLGWLDSMPMEYQIGHADLFYFQAGSMAVSGQLEQANRFLDKAEHFMNRDHALTDEEQRIFQMKMNLYRASVAYYQGDIDSFLAILDTNLEALERFASIVKVINTTEALLYRGPIGFGGRLKKMAYLSLKVSSSEQRRAMLHYTLQGHGFIFLSDLYYEWNRLEEAYEQAEKALASHEVSRHISVWVTGIVVKSKIYKATGKAADAEQILQSGLHEVKLLQAPRWERLLEAAYIRLKLSLGSSDAGDRWLAKHHLSTTDNPHVTREYEQITLAKILMAQQDYVQAIPWLHRLLGEAKRTDRIGSQLEILLLLAQAYDAQNDIAQAWDSLELALSIAASEGYIRIFLDEGLTMAQLLLRWKDQVPTAMRGTEYEYASQLLDLFRSELTKDEGQNRNPLSTLDVHFTNRELELLSYIVQGYSNEEIASELIISPGTVKRYIHHIYQKLDVRNRVQAVARIKEHHLI